MTAKSGTPGTGALERFLDQLSEEGVVTAAAALIGDRRRVLASGETANVDGRLFDLASLTKPVTASLALALDASERLALETAVGEIWPGCATGLARRTLGDLLRHRSGLRPWTPLYFRCKRAEEVEALLLGGDLLGARAGTYSDLGYVLWGLAAQRVLGRGLGELVERYLLERLEMSEGGGRGDERIDLRAAPVEADRSVGCELDTRREVELASAEELAIERQPAPAPGSVQDGNARFLGGYAGHAGLFATPRALYRVAREWLSPGRVFSSSAVRRALTGGRRFACGWERRRIRASGGPALSELAFGHTGFTGGSCWVDPLRDRVFVLLAHRTRELPNLDRWRRRFHALEI